MILLYSRISEKGCKEKESDTRQNRYRVFIEYSKFLFDDFYQPFQDLHFPGSMIHLTYYWLAWANYLIIIKHGPPSSLPLDLCYVWFNCLKYLLIFIMHDSIAWTTFWSLSCMIDLLSFLLIFRMTQMLLYCWSLLNASLLFFLLNFSRAWPNCFPSCWSLSSMI